MKIGRGENGSGIQTQDYPNPVIETQNVYLQIEDEIFNDLLSGFRGRIQRARLGRFIVFRMVVKMTEDCGKQVYVSRDNRSDRA